MLFKNLKFFLIPLLVFVFPLASISAKKKAKNNFLPRTFTATFEQSYISSLSGKEKKSRGKIDYKYPGRIRFEIEKPDKIIFVSNRKKTWHYTAPFIDGEPGQLNIENRGNILLSKFFDQLKQGLRDNKFYRVKIEKKKVDIIFAKETSEKLGILKGVLLFKDKSNKNFENISTFEIIYPNKKHVMIKVLTLRKNLTFGKKHFHFTPPPNTTIAH